VTLHFQASRSGLFEGTQAEDICKEAAEKGVNLGENPEIHFAGAKSLSVNCKFSLVDLKTILLDWRLFRMV
jgi:hypothetical protein